MVVVAIVGDCEVGLVASAVSVMAVVGNIGEGVDAGSLPLRQLRMAALSAPVD